MAACRNCGNPLQPQQAFCKQCGAKVSLENQSREAQRSRITLSAPIKWAIAAVLVLTVGLFVANTILLNYYKPEKTIERFEKAVKDKDYASLRKILESGGTDSALSDDELKGFTVYLTKENNFNDIVKELQQDATGIKNYKPIHPITDNVGNRLLTLEEGPKKFFLYQQYTIKAYPFTITANSNLKNTKVFYNGKSSKLIKKADKDTEITKVLPGNLTLKAVYEGDYVTLKKESKVDFTEASDNAVQVQLDLGGKFVSLYSNDENADIYVNGKKTSLKVGDSFGPVSTDGKVELYAVDKLNGASIKSNVVKIDQEGDVDLNFKEIADQQSKADTKKQIMDALSIYPGTSPSDQMKYFMNQLLSASVSAINSRDFSVVSSYFKPDSPGYNETKDYIPVLEKKGITESFNNVEILDMQTTDNGFKVKTREEYEIYYSDGTSKQKTFESLYTLVASEFGLQEYKLESTNAIN